MTERNVKLLVKCHVCDTQHSLMVTEESYQEFIKPNRKHIQDIFPYLTADERELLISHTCKKCWDKMFGTDEDEDDDFEISSEDLKEWQNASCGLC